MSKKVWIDHQDEAGTCTPMTVTDVPRVGEYVEFEVRDVNRKIWDDIEPERIAGRVTRVTHRHSESRRGREPYVSASATIQLDQPVEVKS